MIRMVFVAILAFASTASAEYTFTETTHDLSTGGTTTGWGSIFDGAHLGNTLAISAIGGTYGIDPLVQDGISAFYISSTLGSTFTFDGTNEAGGTNLAGGTGATFVVSEAETDLGGGQILLQTEITSIDAAGSPIPWVAAGVTGPAGPFTSWRIDMGGVAAFPDKLTPNQPWIVDSSGFEAFDSAGVSLGAFGLTIDNSDASGLSGVGVVGLGGADIAGFDMASMQIAYTVSIPEPSPAITLGLLFLGLCIARFGGRFLLKTVNRSE